MPTNVVDLSITTDTAAPPAETFNDTAVVGTAASSPSGANFGEANKYSSASKVETDYGTSSDVAVTSRALEEMGVQDWYVIVLEETAVTGESLTEASIDTLANFPVLGDPTPTVDTDQLNFVAGTPDNSITSDTDLNTDTGEYYTAETGISMDYSYVDWSQLDNALQGLGIELLIKGDAQYDREHIGSLDEIVSWVDANDAATVAASVNGSNMTEDKAMSIAHDVFGYVPSGACLAIAHKSSADVGGYVAGQAANEEPWFDVFYDGDGYPFDTGYYRAVNVGDPSSGGTFEGGDAANQEGPTNVVINKGGVDVLSNSLSTAGASSNYPYWDIKRTENYAAAQVQSALRSLRLSEDRIPFTTEGRALIKGALTSAFSGDVGGVNDPFSSVTVYVPKVSTLSDSEKANRIWSGITIEATLSGNVHEFQLSMNISV